MPANFKRIFHLLLILTLLVTLSCTSQGQSKKEEVLECKPPLLKVKVQRAIDGDTVLLEGGERLRYAGINTLELHTPDGKPEPLAEEAYRRNRELTEGKSFCLEKTLRERDHYGRLLGDLYFPNGTSISEILLSEGLGLVCFYEGSAKISERLLPVQREALMKRVGLFSYVEKPQAKVNFIGNKKSRRFHHPDCKEARKIKQKVIFNNLEEPLREGYCPSRECLPLIFPN
jgi:micrococcal nuclease